MIETISDDATDDFFASMDDNRDVNNQFEIDNNVDDKKPDQDNFQPPPGDPDDNSLPNQPPPIYKARDSVPMPEPSAPEEHKEILEPPKDPPEEKKPVPSEPPPQYVKPASDAKQPEMPNNIVNAEKNPVDEVTPPTQPAQAEVKNSNTPPAPLKEVEPLKSSKDILRGLNISAKTVEKNLADGKSPSLESIAKKQSQVQQNINNPSVKNRPDEPEPDKPEDKTPKRRR